MKLRNKKTGDILEQAVIKSYACGAGYRLMVCNSPYSDIGQHYDTLAELNEAWEDYEPKEPLIKDREARELIRKFADRCGIKTFVYSEEGATLRGANSGCIISFGAYIYDGLEDGVGYDIDELCGEEECEN